MESSQDQFSGDPGGADKSRDLCGLYARGRRPGHVQSAPSGARSQLALLSVDIGRCADGSLQHPLPRSQGLRDASSPRVHVHRRGKRDSGTDTSNNEGSGTARSQRFVRYDGATPSAGHQRAHPGRVPAARGARRAVQRVPAGPGPADALAATTRCTGPISCLRIRRHESTQTQKALQYVSHP